MSTGGAAVGTWSCWAVSALSCGGGNTTLFWLFWPIYHFYKVLSPVCKLMRLSPEEPVPVPFHGTRLWLVLPGIAGSHRLPRVGLDGVSPMHASWTAAQGISGLQLARRLRAQDLPSRQGWDAPGLIRDGHCSFAGLGGSVGSVFGF